MEFSKIVRLITRVLYRWILKPYFFLFDPERVHNLALKAGRLLGTNGASRGLIRGFWYYQHPALCQEVFGVTFANPIGLSAGFDKDADLVNILPELGFGYAQIGSVTDQSYSGNPPPRLFRLKKSRAIVVYYGLKNIGAEAVIEKMRRYGCVKIPISISVAKTNSAKTADDEAGVRDYCACLRKFSEAALGDLYTINISCPNTFGGEPFTTPDKLERLLAAIDDVGIQKPVLVKMPIDLSWLEFKELIDVVRRHNCQGVVIGNLTKDKSNKKIVDRIPENVKGSISGKPTEDRVNDLISRTYKYCGRELKIVGVGGVFSAEDAYEKIKRGATLVQLITGMIYEGPQLIGEINQGLVRLMRRDGFKSVSDVVGSRL